MSEANIPEKPSVGQLWADMKKYKMLYVKVLSATFVVAAIIAISIPNYYKCTVKLAPELSGGNKSSGGLASLASSFGVNLGESSAGADAIVPTLYPDLMNSVTFQTSLFPIKVQREGEDSTMTYYDYLKNHQRLPWWSAAMKSVLSMFRSVLPLGSAKNDQSSMFNDSINPFRLTKDQSKIVELMGKKVVCDVDNKTMVITIDVIDQDPVIAASVADSVQNRLQDFITVYRTSKARVDLAYNQKLYKETKARYEKARQLYAEYSDANQDIILQTVRQRQTELENEMQLQYNAYTQIAAQLLAAEAKVQQETPAFTMLQPATVPVRKAGPMRSRGCLLVLFLAFIAITLYVWNKENHLKPFFRPRKGEMDFDELSMTELLKLISNTPQTSEKKE